MTDRQVKTIAECLCPSSLRSFRRSFFSIPSFLLFPTPTLSEWARRVYALAPERRFPFDHADRSELEDLIIDADLVLRCRDEDSDSGADVEDAEDEAAARKEKGGAEASVAARVGGGRDLLLGLPRRGRGSDRRAGGARHAWFSGGGLPLGNHNNTEEHDEEDDDDDDDDDDAAAGGIFLDDDDDDDDKRCRSRKHREKDEGAVDNEMLWHVHEIRPPRAADEYPDLSFKSGTFLVGGDEGARPRLRRWPRRTHSCTWSRLASGGVMSGGPQVSSSSSSKEDGVATFTGGPGARATSSALRAQFAKQQHQQGAALGGVGVARFAVRVVGGDVSVSVLDAATMQWAVEHDYRLEVELHRTLAARKKIVAALLDAEEKEGDGSGGGRGRSASFSSSSSSSSAPSTPQHGPYMSPRLGPALFYGATLTEGVEPGEEEPFLLLVFLVFLVVVVVVVVLGADPPEGRRCGAGAALQGGAGRAGAARVPRVG